MSMLDCLDQTVEFRHTETIVSTPLALQAGDLEIAIDSMTLFWVKTRLIATARIQRKRPLG